MLKRRTLRLLKIATLAVGVAVISILAWEYAVKPIQKSAAERAETVADEKRRIAERNARAVPRQARPAHPDRPTVALIDFTVDRDSYRRQQTAAAFAEITRAKLSQDDRYAWLNRTDLQRVRDELELSVTMSYGSSAEALQFGQWLNAHLIVTGRFVDTAGPDQRLVIEVIETLTADRLAQRTVDVPYDLRDTNNLPDRTTEETQQAVRDALAEAHDVLLNHQGSTVVSLISIANLTGDPRMDQIPERLNTAIKQSAQTKPGVRIVQVQNPDPAMTEQDLSLTGLTSMKPQAWRTAADVYVWGTISRPGSGPLANPREVQRLDSTAARVKLTFTVWNGFDDPQKIAMDGTRDQIDVLFDRLVDQVWDLVQQPLPKKLDLQQRDVVARNFSMGTNFRFSSSDGPDSDAARRMNRNIQARQAAWFFTPESFATAANTLFFKPVIHPDRVLSGQLAHITAIDRVIYRFDWETGRDRNKPTTEALDRLAQKSIRARNDLADLIIPSRKSLHRDLMSARSPLPADMPMAARAALHDENLRGIARLGRLLVEKMPPRELEDSRRGVRIDRDSLTEMILDMPGGSPARIVEAWDAWWPIVRVEWREELRDPPNERRFLSPRRENRLRQAYQDLGRGDELTALLDAERRTQDPGQNARLIRPVDHEKARSLIQAYDVSNPPNVARAPQLPGTPPALSAPIKVDAATISVGGLQLRIIADQADVAAGVRMSYEARGFRVHQLKDLGGQVLLIATRRRSPRSSSGSGGGQNLSSLSGVMALISPEHLQLKHLSFAGLENATVTDAAVVGDELWISTDLQGLHIIQMSSGRIEPVAIVGELPSPQIRHFAVTDVGVVVADEQGRTSLLEESGDGSWRARDLKWNGGGITHIDRMEAKGSILLVKFDGNTHLVDLSSDRVFDLGKMVSQHQQKRGGSWISDAVFYKNDVLMIGRQKLFHVTDFQAVEPRLEVLADGLNRNSDGRLVVDGDDLWVMMTESYPQAESWHTSPLRYSGGAQREEPQRSTVALWDFEQKDWAGQFHVEGETTHLRPLGPWLLVASYNGLRDMLLINRAAVMTGMGKALTEDDESTVGLVAGLGGTAEVSALMREAAAGDTASLQRRIDAGEPIDTPTSDGWTPLMSAVLSGQADAARVLLEGGADPNQINRGTLRNTPASLASALNRADLLELLDAHGLDVDGYTNLWANPAAAAVLHRSHDALRWLADHDAKINYWLKTLPGRNMWWHSPLFMAISRGDVATVKLLLELGASPSHVTGPETYTTPVQYALSLHRDDIATLLIDAGADLNETSSYGSPALNHALPDIGQVARAIPLLDLVELMLDRGADSTRAPEFTYWALKNLGADMARRLIEDGNELGGVLPEDAIRGFGGPRHISGPFTYAVALAENHDTALITAQLERHALNLDLRVGEHRQGDLLATTLASRRQYKAALGLVEQGYEIDLVDALGKTALHRAMRSQRASDINILLSLGSNPFIRDRDGNNAFDLAKKQYLRDLLNRESLYVIDSARL